MQEFIPSPTLIRFAELKAIVRRGEKSAKKALLQAGHSPELVEVIFAIKNAPESQATPSQIAENLGLTPSTITNRINRLQNLNLIANKPTTDLRQTLLQLTPAGHTLWLQSAKIYNQAIVATFVDGIPIENPLTSNEANHKEN
jgi:DNA-binding MarR family transcriptional regulator